MKYKSVIYILIALLFAINLFHLLIFIKVIPYEITWGGKLNNDTEMYIFESISILTNVFLILILLMKAQYISSWFKEKNLNRILWAFFILFCLNTAGNLLAVTLIEKSFAVLTFILASLLYILLNPRRKQYFQK